ncbi:MAG: XRE family transcriptional regulator [uncultured bacterium]|uniref:HTH cro/C1-type domain-containing protein n=1 Tax=candidate division WWE3 bacterium RBG_16_37_10 TaxID=1802610 RepID=A0A1F4V330_UNCKA|nr:MAG: XRE family transcriptional regulator [uncultured bacterium]OGC51597.1 MAG: hypothetical protein A2W32_00965 [candidate division WWE3 bacterium RBG_16_37_10]
MQRSVGQLLKSAREEKKYTLQDVHKFIRIHPKYLKALEEDDYEVFEGKIHAKGFLKVYSEFLNVNINEIMALWRREYEPRFEGEKKQARFFKLEPVEKAKLVVTTPFILSVIFGVFVLVFFGYLYYQYHSYTGNPRLEIFSPQNNQMMDSDIVDVLGNTDLDCDVFINNQKVVLNPNGDFGVTIRLKEGINTLSIVAVNKLEKKTDEIRTVIYRSQKLEMGRTKESSESSSSTPSKP